MPGRFFQKTNMAGNGKSWSITIFYEIHRLIHGCFSIVMLVLGGVPRKMSTQNMSRVCWCLHFTIDLSRFFPKGIPNETDIMG